MAKTGHAADVSRQKEEVVQSFDQFLSQLVPGSQEAVALQAAKQRGLTDEEAQAIGR